VSLSAHLTAGTAEHGRLAFHPDCPRCRAERLAGSLAADSLVPRRGQAALAAGLLAFSTGAAPALAQVPGPDQEQEITPGGEPPGLEPDFDPGGDDTFDYDTAPVPGGPEAGGHEDEGVGPPVEIEPTTEPDALLLLEEEHAPPSQPTTPEPVPALPPAPPSALATPAPPPPEPPAAELEQPARQPEERQTSRERKAPEGSPKAHEHERRPVIGPSPTPPPESRAPVAEAVTSSAPPTAAPVATTPQPTTAPVSLPSAPAGGPISGRSYTVRAGDSLWSIARRLLGSEASAGRIAREVNRLWELNRDRIGTGNPSLIHVGTVLKL
jgi:nucleoid-associated protein YgaU